MEKLFEEFKSYRSKIDKYAEAVELLTWDMQTGAPKDSIEHKIDAIGFFSTEIFRLTTADEYGNMLEELIKPENFEKLDEGMKLTVKRETKDFERFKRVPEDFYEEYTKTTARSEQAWEDAKEANDFSVFEPHLDKVIRMTKEYVKYMEPDQDPYEVLLDMYEEGMDSASIDKIFNELKEGLIPLLEEIKAKPAPDLSVMQGVYSRASEKEAQDFLLDYIGFNFNCGATGESMHPFTTTLCPGDVRITNSFDETNPVDAMFSAIHEGGHAIFEQNIDKKYEGTEAAVVNMMGLHESQSRFFENILGRNINFWKPVYEKLGRIMPQLSRVPIETFEKAINYVKADYIRTQADEVTYCMHIILRYEMEKAIFRDNVPTAELPALWMKKSEELLGVIPPDDGKGILQDMHWSDGSFGYFPSYLLGSVYDGMFLEAMEKDLGSVDAVLAEGRIKDITKWLNEKIHRYGSLYNSKEVLQRVCGKEVTAEPLLRYFREKYSRIYNL